jgi:hypothetical protein
LIAIADESAKTEPSEITQARHQLRRLDVELDRLLAAIRAGMDPVLAAGATRQVQAEMHKAESIVAEWEGSQARVAPLDERQIKAVIAEAGGLVGLLADADRADRADRAALYQALCIQLRYEKERPTGRELVHVRSTLGSCGGPISALATTRFAWAFARKCAVVVCVTSTGHPEREVRRSSLTISISDVDEKRCALKGSPVDAGPVDMTGRGSSGRSDRLATPVRSLV